MVDRDTFDRRLAKLEELLRDLRRLRAVSLEEFLRDRGVQAQAERWLQLAAERAIDLANQLIAERGWRTPRAYREAFAVLREEAVLDTDLAGSMERWAGLRDALTHLYLDLDQRRIHDVLQHGLDELERFAAAAARAATGGG